jgi:hypothetical protein
LGRVTYSALKHLIFIIAYFIGEEGAMIFFEDDRFFIGKRADFLWQHEFTLGDGMCM